MAILRQIEWNLNAWRRDRKRQRKWKREREAATLPDPTCVWTRDGFTVQAFVVKSGFSVFASIEPLFRVGVVKMSRNGPTFSPYFPKHGAEILLALLEQVESWNAMLSKTRFARKLIPASQWRAACDAIPTTSANVRTLAFKADRVECRFIETSNPRAVRPQQHYKIVVPEESIYDYHECFFPVFDFPGVRAALELLHERHVIDAFSVESSPQEVPSNQVKLRAQHKNVEFTTRRKTLLLDSERTRQFGKKG